jgi:hypothetical protein
MKTRFCLCLLLLLLAGGQHAFAQEAIRVRVLTAQDDQVAGMWTPGSTGDSLIYVVDRFGFIHSFHLDEIHRMDRSTGRNYVGGVLAGVSAGFLAGAAIGSLAPAGSGHDPMQYFETGADAVFGAMVGAGLGAVLGILMAPDRWTSFKFRNHVSIRRSSPVDISIRIKKLPAENR